MFEVDMSPRSPAWAWEERILALDLYLREGLLGRTDPAVIALSHDLNALTIHPDRSDFDRFRNPNGVAMKLGNFASLDPNFSGRGLTQVARGDREVWNRYASDEDELAAATTAVRKGYGLPAEPTTESAESDRFVEVDVETQHVEQFRVTVPHQDRMATQSELTLVEAFRDYLQSKGRRVTKHAYPLHGSSYPLSCDLVDRTDHVLYEAKGDVLRTSVRMAIGQLFDYRRFEDPQVRLAVLLPRKPAQDLIDLIHTVPASAVWRTEGGFESDHPSVA